MSIKTKISNHPWLSALATLGLMTIITVIFILKDTQLDTPPTHLQHTYNHIEDSQNLYLDFLNALDDLQTINSNYDEMNEQLISQTLKDTEDNIPESIKKFRKEILSTKAYNSPFPDPANFDIRGLSEIRAFFRYECALMKEYGKNEEWAKVIQKINLLSSFYNRVNTINSSIEGLILIACRGIYLGAVQHILNQQNLPIDVLKKIILQIDRDRSWQETARQSYTAELQFLKGSLSSPLAADPIHRIMRPNILYNRAIPYFDFFIKSLSTPQIKIKKPTIVDNLNKNKNDYFYLMKHREDMLLAMIMPALDAIRCKMLALGWKEDFVKLRAAAILYNKYNGSLPSNLNELVPEYIPSVPRDMYSGEEVKYNYEKAFFYIIGPDLKDDLGRQEYNWRNLQKDYKGDYKQEIFVDRNTIGERKSLRRMRARRLPSK